MVKSQKLFYTGGGLPPNYSNYIIRHADQDAICSLINNDKFIFISAPRQIGKTSLLNRVSAELKRMGWLCPTIDLSTFRNLDEPTWYHCLGKQIVEGCKIENLQFSLENQQHFRSFLLDDIGLKKSAQSIKLALIFDEIDGLLDLNFREVFLSTLRDIYQIRYSYSGKFLAAFAGSIDPKVLIQGPTSPFNIADEISLNDFTPGESNKLTTNLGKLDVEVIGNVHDEIYQWASGQPHLTQRICEIIENMVRNKEITTITPEVVDNVIHSFILSPCALDSNVSHVQNEVTRLTSYPSDLWKKLVRGETVTSTSNGYYALALTGAVAEGKNGNVKIRNKIYISALKPILVSETNYLFKFGVSIKNVLGFARPIGNFFFDIFGRSVPKESLSPIILGWVIVIFIIIIAVGFVSVDTAVNAFKDAWRFFFPVK
jgi:hypothetical protein